MEKLIIPGSNDREKAMFEKLNINLIESITTEDFKKLIVNYLNCHNVLHLATCKNNEPRCTPLEYYNNNLTVYISSEGGGKIANLKVNPKVSYSISDPYEPSNDFFGASGLQVWGEASIFKKNDDLKKYEEIHKYSRNGEALKKQGLDLLAAGFNFNVITIEPVRIRYLNLRKGFRNVVWTKEPD